MTPDGSHLSHSHSTQLSHSHSIPTLPFFTICHTPILSCITRQPPLPPIWRADDFSVAERLKHAMAAPMGSEDGWEAGPQGGRIVDPNLFSCSLKRGFTLRPGSAADALQRALAEVKFSHEFHSFVCAFVFLPFVAPHWPQAICRTPICRTQFATPHSPHPIHHTPFVTPPFLPHPHSSHPHSSPIAPGRSTAGDLDLARAWREHRRGVCEARGEGGQQWASERPRESKRSGGRSRGRRCWTRRRAR